MAPDAPQRLPGRRRPARARAAAALGVALLVCACSTAPAPAVGGTTQRATTTATGASGSSTRPSTGPSFGDTSSRAATSGPTDGSPTAGSASSRPAPARTTPDTSAGRTSGTHAAAGSSASSTSPTRAAPRATTGAPTSPAGGTPAAAALGGDLGLAGLNDPACRSATPPVVLLQGTLSSVASNFGALVPELRAAGVCPYAQPFRFGGTVAVRETAGEQADFVRRVLASTGAPQVDLVGFSQGALVARTALRENGIAAQVRVLVLVAGTYHGTTAALLDRVPGAVCAACVDQRAGSGLLQALDAGGDLDGEVRYAAVSSRADRVVTPVERQTPAGPADRVSWTVLQDHCPTSTTPHEAMLADPSVRRWIVAALASGGRPTAGALSC